MVRSMTGYGRFEESNDKRRVSVEMKSVNHRYLDLNIKMPRKLNAFEPRIRSLLKSRLSRGKVDVFVSFEDYEKRSSFLKYNAALAKTYMEYLHQISEDFSIDMDIRTSTLSRYPEVLTMEEENDDDESIWEIISKAVNAACDAFVASREKEGDALKNDLMGKLRAMEPLIDQVEERAPEILKEHRERLLEKVRELLGDTHIEESRIASEIVIYADKICTDEETVRLRSHLNNMLDVLETGDEIGRKLDFIAQEMNREANTILSKANDKITSDIGIRLKTEIEKIREQIQNIE
ncbi:MAG: YicC family protein [Lachnospiraceae bacterium]|nr:YicC family protein [Lachnospiraceae bacterium]